MNFLQKTLSNPIKLISNMFICQFPGANSRHKNWIEILAEVVISTQGVSRMVEKLNDMLKHRYGKGLSIRRLAGIGQDLSEETSLRGEDLYIPIFVKEIFLGYGLVHEARDLSFDDQSQVARLVRMILEPHLYSQHLERTLSNIEIEKSLIAENPDEPKTKGLFLYGTQPNLVQKTALELHELSQNMGYMPFSDLAAEINSVHDLEMMESSTLVVDLNRVLSFDHQKILTEFVTKSQKGSLVIFVAEKAANHLFIEADFRSMLKNIEFSVDRLPLNKQAMNEVLEMLYFKT